MYTILQKKRVRRIARSFLREVGLPPNKAGFPLMVELISIVAEYPDKISPLAPLMESCCKDLNIHYYYNTTFHRIKDAISIIYSRCSPEKLDEHFASCTDPKAGHMTVAEFIATAAAIVNDRTIKVRDT